MGVLRSRFRSRYSRFITLLISTRTHDAPKKHSALNPKPRTLNPKPQLLGAFFSLLQADAKPVLIEGGVKGCILRSDA